MKTRRGAVRGIIFKDGKLLCQQLKSYRRDDPDFWCTPGGGLEVGEPVKAGLHREIVEETGIAPKIGRLLFVQQFSEDGQKEQMEYFFHIENPEDYKEIDLSVTSHGHIEIEHVEFIDPKGSGVLPEFLQEIDLEHYTATVQPVFLYTDLN